ncbi:MAG: hypothetical protein K6E40_01940 [Desulfovibrio sp.]|nr:hypothetical protein [Desulfovibrio sp.]
MPDASKPMTLSVQEQDWLAGASPRVRAMSAELQTRLFAFGSGVSARISPRHGLRSCIFSVNGRPFAYAFPHGTRIRLLLNLKREELDDPDGVAECIAGRSHEGQGDWQIDVADGRDLERAMPLIRQAFNAAVRRA